MGGESNHEFIRNICLSQIVLPRLFFSFFFLFLLFSPFEYRFLPTFHSYSLSRLFFRPFEF